MSPDDPQWYCVLARLKAEHIALRHLEVVGFEAFLPRIRFQRSTARGPVWFTEPLFPSYLFARFHWSTSYRHVRSINGVAGLVELGNTAPSIDATVIAELRKQVGPKCVYTLEPGIVHLPSKSILHQYILTPEMEIAPGPLRVRALLAFLSLSDTALEPERKV